jgi:hypothetical protein
MTFFRSGMPKEERSAIVQYAFFRWENAVVLGGTILLTGLYPKPFPWWPPWGWPVLGILGMAVLVYSSLTNARANARVLLKMFQSQFDLKAIESSELRADVERALAYQRRIETRVREQGESVLWERAEDTLDQLKDWVVNIYRLARRLDAYQRDAILHQQREAVPKEIEALRRRQKGEPSAEIQAHIEEVLESKARQRDTLQALEMRMQQAELSLAQTLTAMATVDSQFRLIAAQDVASGRSERLRAEIMEQINQLNDLVGSINEVYDYHTPGLG